MTEYQKSMHILYYLCYFFNTGREWDSFVYQSFSDEHGILKF